MKKYLPVAGTFVCHVHIKPQSLINIKGKQRVEVNEIDQTKLITTPFHLG